MTNYFSCKQGFSLIELAIAMGILSLLATSIVPIGIRSVQIKAVEKTSLEILMIQEASINYYRDRHSWPEDLAKLQSEGYLNSSWVAENPWKKSYQISLNPVLGVSTEIPKEWIALLKRNLPGSTDQESSVDSAFSMVLAPMSSLEKMNALPVGSILPWPSSELPEGFLWCYGQTVSISQYPALYQIIGHSYGEDGQGTFKIPDLRGKTVFGYQPGDDDFGSLGQRGGNKTHSHLIDGKTDRATLRSGGSWRIDDNSGGSDYNVMDPHLHDVHIESNSQKHLPPYLTSNFIIKY